MDNPYQSSVPTEILAEGGSASVSTVDALSRTRPWVRLCSGIGFLATGIMILMGIVILATGTFASVPSGRAPGMSWLKYIGVIYIVMAVFYLIPSLKLWSYGSSIRNLAMSRSNHDLQAALEQHRSFWKFISIMIIIAFALTVVFIVGILIVGFGAAMSMRPAP